MCGIAGFVVKDPTKTVDRDALLDALLREIDHRGGDATGFVAYGPDSIVWDKAACGADDFIQERRRVPANATAVVAHTRFATQGNPGFSRNNHPIRRGPFYLTHNGHVTNDRALFASTGLVPHGTVDSEAIAALLEARGTLDGCGQALEAIDGSAAVAVLDSRDGSVLLARVSGSPLHVLETRRVIIYGSTSTAVSRAHVLAIGSLGRTKVEYWHEGEGAVIRDGRIHPFTFDPPLHQSSWKTSSYVPSKPAASLPATTIAPDWEHWRACDLCGSYVPELSTVQDHAIDDTWSLCDDCVEELASWIPETAIVRQWS